MFDKILVPVDGSAMAASALSHAIAVMQPDTGLTLLRVLESSARSSTMINPIDWQLQRTEAVAYLDELGNIYSTSATLEKIVQEGSAAERILEQAQECAHDLIVLSSHGRSGLSDWNISSVANKVISRCGASVLLVRSYKLSEPNANPVQAMRYRRILVPLDGSLRSENVLSAAIQIAQHHNAELLLVHGIVTPELFRSTPGDTKHTAFVDEIVAYNKQQAEAYLEELAHRLNLDVETYVLTGDDVAEALHRFVEEKAIDLVILSAHGRSGKHMWPYGSITSSFIAYGTTHLLIIQDRPWREIKDNGVTQATKTSGTAGAPHLVTHTTPLKPMMHFAPLGNKTRLGQHF